jgi:hypothetical protein
MEEIIRTTIATTIEEIIQYSNLLCFDRSTLILSVIAIIISIWSAIWTVKKNNKQNYNNSLYEDILKDDLHKKMPMLIHKSIDVKRKCVNDQEINELEVFLSKLRESILVFKYINPEFYKKLDGIIVNIDENIVLISTRNENFDKRYGMLMSEIKKLYKCIEKNLFK